MISTQLKHFINNASFLQIGSQLCTPGYFDIEIRLKRIRRFPTLNGEYGPRLCLSLHADSTKVKGEYEHITLYRDTLFSDFKKFYSMQFKDGKEYEGYCDLPELQYKCHEGVIVGKNKGISFSKEADGRYTEFFDKIDGKKKVEGFYKEGKKEGVWKYYDKDGTVIRQEYWHEGNDCTKKYEVLKKVASKRIEEENKLSEDKDERVVLPKMTAKEKRKAVREARKDLSR